MVVGTFLSALIASLETTRQTQSPVRQHCIVEPINHSYRYIDKVAIDKFKPGDAVVIFTPDSKCPPAYARKLAVRGALLLKDTHYAMARYAIERGLHVLVTKPATQLLSHHLELIELSRKHNVVCFVEHHKRFAPVSHSTKFLPYANGRLVFLRYDPVYSDARVRARTLGEFNFFNAWMSQPKSQLETFRAWAGKDSDIR